MQLESAPPTAAEPNLTERILDGFARCFSEAHLYLAYHAAFPLSLTPDLLYRIWANFQRDGHGRSLTIPWVAVADLLLSRFCDEVGHELYEMDPTIRQLLLRRLTADLNFGKPRIQELSDFTLAYVDDLLTSPDPEVRDFAQVQRWGAIAYVRPKDAARELAQALTHAYERDRPDLNRIASVVESLADPLADFPTLLTYARGMARLARGDEAGAATHFEKLLTSGQPVTVAGVPLPLPEQPDLVPPKPPLPRRWLYGAIAGATLMAAIAGALWFRDPLIGAIANLFGSPENNEPLNSAGNLTLSPQQISFGVQTIQPGNNTPVRMVTVTNPGTTSIEIQDISINAISFDSTPIFSIIPGDDIPGEPNECFESLSLAPGESCTIAVIFTPREATDYLSALTVRSSSTNNPIIGMAQGIALSGTGVDTTASASPTPSPTPMPLPTLPAPSQASITPSPVSISLPPVASGRPTPVSSSPIPAESASPVPGVTQGATPGGVTASSDATQSGPLDGSSSGSQTETGSPTDVATNRDSTPSTPNPTTNAANVEDLIRFEENTRTQIATIQRGQEEIVAELATVRGRVDALEALVSNFEEGQRSDSLTDLSQELTSITQRLTALGSALDASVGSISGLRTDLQTVSQGPVITTESGADIAAGFTNDVTVLGRLSEEFAAELATLRGRRDALAVRITNLETTALFSASTSATVTSVTVDPSAPATRQPTVLIRGGQSTQLTEGTTLQVGDRITTGRSSVTIQYSNGTQVRLDPNTTFTFEPGSSP